jgi:hypothetical protein
MIASMRHSHELQILIVLALIPFSIAAIGSLLGARSSGSTVKRPGEIAGNRGPDTSNDRTSR